MYIAEIAPSQWRGRLVGLFQFNVVFGILLAYFSNYLIGLMHFGTSEWRWMLGVAGLPALLFLLMLFAIPRSPRWLVKKRRVDEARDVLKSIGEPDYERELRDIVSSIDAEHGHANEPLFSPKYLCPSFSRFRSDCPCSEETVFNSAAWPGVEGGLLKLGAGVCCAASGLR